MNKFNLIKQEKNIVTNEFNLKIDQYLIYEDLTNNTKFTVIKLHNLFNEQLTSIKFNLQEYDDSNNLINEHNYLIDNLSFDANQILMLPFKFLLTNKTNAIKLNILNKVLVKEEIIEQPEVKTIVETSLDNKLENQIFKLPIKPPYQEQVIKRKSETIKLRSVMLMVVALLITTLTSILGMVAFKYQVNKHELIYDSNNGMATIIGYSGLKSDIVIPKTLDGVPVRIINQGAFKNSEITSITIEAENIHISAEAFYGADKLVSFKANHVTSIGNKAFYQATSLKNFTVSSYNNVKELAFSYTPSLTKLNTTANRDNINYEFNALLNSSLNNYFNYGDYEVLNGEIITIRPNTYDLVIESYSEAIFFSNRLNIDELYGLWSLKILKPNFKISQEDFIGMVSLHTLHISSLVITEDPKPFRYLSRTVREIKIPVIGDMFIELFDYYLNYHFDIVIITDTRDIESWSYYILGLYQIASEIVRVI